MKASDYSGNVPRMVGDWSYSNNEDGNGDGMWSNSTTSREAAIEEAIAEAQGDGDEPEFVYVAECIEAEVPEPCAESLLERMIESAWENLGEVSEGWPENTKEQMDELQEKLTEVVGSWMTKHNLWPTFCGIGRVEKVAVETVEAAK